MITYDNKITYYSISCGYITFIPLFPLFPIHYLHNIDHSDGTYVASRRIGADHQKCQAALNKIHVVSESRP